MNVTGNQIAAAMKLIGKNNTDIAYATNLSGVTITKALRDEVKHKTKMQIVNYLISRDIEFIPNGIRIKPKATINQLEGKAGFYEFMQDVLAAASSPDADICVSGVDESLFEKWQGEHAEQYLRTMDRFHNINNFSFRVITKEGDNYQTASGYAKYKAMPEDDFQPTAIYVYGDKKAEIIFDPHNVTIIITKSKILAAAYRTTFNRLWDNM